MTSLACPAPIMLRGAVQFQPGFPYPPHFGLFRWTGMSGPVEIARRTGELWPAVRVPMLGGRFGYLGVNCFRGRHPGNANGVVRDRYKCGRLLRCRILRTRRSGMTGAELRGRIWYDTWRSGRPFGTHESGWGLVSRASPVHTGMRSCMRDEGRSFGFGNQVADPKPPQAAVVKSHGSERCGKARTMILAGTVERGERKRTAAEASKAD